VTIKAAAIYGALLNLALCLIFLSVGNETMVAIDGLLVAFLVFVAARA
jgi:hypothetical protein